MNLKSFGCSFIYGSELADEKWGGSLSAWPALLANQLGYEYYCYARPGSGNLRIAESVLNQLADNEPTLYVIGWSWIDRFDYTTPDDKWCTVMPGDNDEQAQVYYRDLHSQYRDKLTSLMSIKLVLDMLLEKKYPFIRTYMDELLFEAPWHTTAAVTELQNFIRPYMTQFEGKSFLEWSRSQGFEETSSWHPLEEAHNAAAKYIKGQKIL